MVKVKKNLIEKIKEIDDPEIIHEIYRLLKIDLDEDVNKTSDS